MKTPTTLQYVSTIRGFEEQQTGGNYVHYGLVFRVSKEMLLPENMARYVRLMESHHKEVGKLIKKVSRDIGGQVGDVLERYEVFDPDGETFHVIFRVPFRVPADCQARVPHNRLDECLAEDGTLVLGQG